MKVGLLTGGGDCPGLNAVIRAVVQQLDNAGGTCLGILEGWRGLVQNMTCPLTTAQTDGIIAQGGSILGSSRTNPYRNPETDLPALRANFQRLELDALVVIGGDDTLGVALRLHNDFDFPVVGIPKTIDNDLMVTDFSFGFDTAINIVTEAVDRLRTTTESHRRIMVVETMGRHSGWIACFSGMAVGADYILVPEVPIDMPHLVGVLQRAGAAGKKYGIVIVAEGAGSPTAARSPSTTPPTRSATRASAGSAWSSPTPSRSRPGFETRSVVLGHLQRGGPPSAYDRILATRLGLAASRLVLQRRFGTLVTLMNGQIVETPLSESIAATKTLDLSYYDEAAAFFH